MSLPAVILPRGVVTVHDPSGFGDWLISCTGVFVCRLRPFEMALRIRPAMSL
jgi:hypothetical protein